MPGAQGRVPLRNLSESFAHVDSDAQRSKTPPRYEAMSWRRKLAYLKFSGPGNLNQLVEQEVLAPEFFALSMTGLMRSHCSSRLRPLSRNTINPGCAATSRISMKSRAFAVTTAPLDKGRPERDTYVGEQIANIRLRPGSSCPPRSLTIARKVCLPLRFFHRRPRAALLFFLHDRLRDRLRRRRPRRFWPMWVQSPSWPQSFPLRASMCTRRRKWFRAAFRNWTR